MPRTKDSSQAELVQLALLGIDAKIEQLKEKRAQLAALLGTRTGNPAASEGVNNKPVETKPKKSRKMSAAARAKISAAAKARWARIKKQTKTQSKKA